MPYGETWIDEGHETSLLGYKFTGKELDEETGLYYFGARYYDPQFSNWISTDPALEDYLPLGKDLYFPEKAFDANSLKGAGGVYKSTNINLYHYASLNPINYIDPDGRISQDEVYKASEAKHGHLDKQLANKEFETAALASLGLTSTEDKGSTTKSGGTPDVLGSQAEAGRSGFLDFSFRIFKKSVIVEVKNTGKNNSSTNQLIRYINDLKGSTTGSKSGAVPVLIVMTPEGVKLGPQVKAAAKSAGVTLLHFQMITIQGGSNPVIYPVLREQIGHLPPTIVRNLVRGSGEIHSPTFIPRPVNLFK